MQDYQPEPGEIVVRERLVWYGFGVERLDRVQVMARIRVSLAEVEVLAKTYPHLRHMVDPDGVAVEIDLILSDEDVQPYLEWRDQLLIRLYQKAGTSPAPPSD